MYAGSQLQQPEQNKLAESEVEDGHVKQQLAGDENTEMTCGLRDTTAPTLGSTVGRDDGPQQTDPGDAIISTHKK